MNNAARVEGREPRAVGFHAFIELLVVIGIIAILAALLLPTLGRAKERAGRRALSNLRQIGVALQLYVDANNQRLPVMRDKAPGDRYESTADEHLTQCGNRVTQRIG